MLFCGTERQWSLIIPSEKKRKGREGKEGKGRRRRDEKRTNILPKRRRGRRPVRLTLKTVKQRHLVVILAEHRPAGCFDGFDGGFGGAGGCYVDWDFELFGALLGVEVGHEWMVEWGWIGVMGVGVTVCLWRRMIVVSMWCNVEEELRRKGRTSPRIFTPSCASCIHPLSTKSLAVIGFLGVELNRPWCTQNAILSKLTGAHVLPVLHAPRPTTQ